MRIVDYFPAKTWTKAEIFNRSLRVSPFGSSRFDRVAYVSILLVFWVLVASPVAARVIWVGPSADGNCETNSLAAAVLTAAFENGEDAIHLADGVSHIDIRLVLNGFSPDTNQGGLIIRGGFSSCGDAVSTSTRTVIDGRANAPIFEISGSMGGRSVIQLIDLELSGSGERALEVGNGGEVEITNVWVRNNGGAVRVEGNGRFVMESESWLFENSVPSGFGGGVFCTDEAVVNIGGPVSNNFAGQWGGGIFARGSCQVILRSKAWIQSNTATVNGGGIAAFSTALITGSPSAVDRVLINNNVAERGGGIYADGIGTQVLISNTKIENNQAERGAAVYSTNGSITQIYRVPGNSCDDPLRCSTLSFNQLGNDIFGAVAWVDEGASLTISETFIEGNSSATGMDDSISLFAAVDSSSRLVLTNVTIWGNEARYIAERLGASEIRFRHVTTANNSYPSRSGNPRTGLFVGADPNDVTVINSLLWDVSASSGSFGGSCNFASSAAVLSESLQSAVIPDPFFIDPTSGDLRLLPNSPAVDACLPGVASRDIELQNRGVDVEDNANGELGQPGGLYDAGSDEVFDKIFADRFETGSF